jgi:membrane protease YdiL (CAAX protease family)
VLDPGYSTSLARDLKSGLAGKLALGLLAAAALYGVFWAGNELSRALFPFAASDIGRVYGFKSGVPVARVVLLMALVIGPGEEIFWRAYLQRRWQARFGRWPGFLAAAALYTLVHAASGNVMLVLAAAVCGLFWGFLYMRTGSVLLVAVSHTAWDLAVFVLWPFR